MRPRGRAADSAVYLFRYSQYDGRGVTAYDAKDGAERRMQPAERFL